MDAADLQRRREQQALRSVRAHLDRQEREAPIDTLGGAARNLTLLLALVIGILVLAAGIWGGMRWMRGPAQAMPEARVRSEHPAGWYVEKIRAKIRSHAEVPDSVTGKPSVQVQVGIAPGGGVTHVKRLESSGNQAYDDAIEKAIHRAQPLPVPDPASPLSPRFRDLVLKVEHDR